MILMGVVSGDGTRSQDEGESGVDTVVFEDLTAQHPPFFNKEFKCVLCRI